ncbi:sulfite exporter TauE/SafE family protein [Aquisalimonas lutea]|uniref:sulfite exporter TauE/SafE family protein n=1 Tax=Aquisalimonas lutea TaxID=1327750 RepID=UPI0025B4F245|nr:sulfite exporter TauE/SafE family protein [Aquisalimonas lutea]MDN3517362.1 sulfite exporter TauE/SafE family protein [Aquisalimonas lutea]
MEIWTSLLPQDLPAWGAGLLLLASLAASFVTAAFGAGGGVVLLAVMTLFLPVAAVIPLHGVIQAGSNAGRTALTWSGIRWPVVALFSAGGVLGAAAGSRVLVDLPGGWMELALGAFILWSCWGPTPDLRRGSRGRLALGGAATSLATLFVGATGPLVAALLRSLALDRRSHVGTFSACMVIQHGFKLVVYGGLGFAFGPYLPFLAGMITAGLAGTYLGRMALEHLSDRGFHRALTVLLTLLALRLCYTGLTAVAGW